MSEFCEFCRVHHTSSCSHPGRAEYESLKEQIEVCRKQVEELYEVCKWLATERNPNIYTAIHKAIEVIAKVEGKRRPKNHD